MRPRETARIRIPRMALGRRPCWRPRRPRGPEEPIGAGARASPGWAPAASPAPISRWGSRSAGWSTSTGATPACAAPPDPPRVRSPTSPAARRQLRARDRAVRRPGRGPARHRRLRRRTGPFAELRAVLLALSRAADRGRPRRRRHRARSPTSPASAWPRARRAPAPAAVADAARRRRGLDAGELRRHARSRARPAWPTRSARARSTPSSTPSAIRRWSMQEATTGCDASARAGRRPGDRRAGGRQPGLRRGRRSPAGSTAATRAGRDLRRAARRWSPAPDVPEGPLRMVRPIFGDLDTLRGLDPVLADLDARGHGPRRAGRAAAPRRGGAISASSGLVD